MKRVRVNFWIDLTSFLTVLFLGLTGYIMRYVLPPGTGGLGRGFHGGRGREEIQYFLSLTRHEWGSVHFYAAIIFLILMLAHIIMHLTWIKNCFISFFVKRSG